MVLIDVIHYPFSSQIGYLYTYSRRVLQLEVTKSFRFDTKPDRKETNKLITRAPPSSEKRRSFRYPHPGVQNVDYAQ